MKTIVRIYNNHYEVTTSNAVARAVGGATRSSHLSDLLTMELTAGTNQKKQ